jgi:dUTP pyrophosphatase
VILRVRRLDPGATMPRRAFAGDAGLDLHAVEALTLAPGARASVGTGIAVELAAGRAALVLPRSGLAARHGIALVNSPGLIDSGYRGEVRVVLLTTDRERPFQVQKGDRVAQLVVIAVDTAEPQEVDELSDSDRGSGGFGSSGV